MSEAEDTFSSDIVIHEITESSLWPSEISFITSLLIAPLTSIPNVASELLSPSALQIYNELKESPLLSVVEDSEIIGIDSTTAILDTLLTCVKMLRELADSGDGPFNSPRPTLSVWGILLSALSSTCSKESILLADVPFLLPRTMTLTVAPEATTFEGRAHFLIALCMAPTKLVKDEMDMNKAVSSDKDSSAGSTSSGNTSSGTSTMSLDGPVDGHIFPGRGRRVSCVRPVVCIADKNNIRALVTSTVYQRYSWGISLPTIGISIEKGETTAFIVVGWIETRYNNGHCPRGKLPPVHLAFSSSTQQIDSRLGVFDLLDSLSALHFARFILGLQDQFFTIATNRVAPHGQDICWRLDHALVNSPAQDPHQESTTPETWNEGILKWASGVGLSDSPGYNYFFPLPPQRLPTYPMPSARSQTSAGKNKDQEASIAPMPASYPQSSANSLQPPPQSHSKAGSSKKTKSSYSASEFADLKDDIIKSEPGTEHWLWERCTIRVGRFKATNPEIYPADTEIATMIDYYNNIFQLSWPEKWSNPTERKKISCNPIYRKILDLLFTQYESYLNDIKDPKDIKYTKLIEDEFLCLESRLPMFLGAVASAANRKAQQNILLNEAETRGEFDLMLQVFCCPREKAVSDTFFLELPIQLSKNQAIGGTLHNTEQSELWFNVTSRQSVSPDIRKYPHIRHAIMALHKWASAKLEKIETYKPPLPADRLYEPSQAVVDGAVCARVTVSLAATAPMKVDSTTSISQSAFTSAKKPIWKVFADKFKSGAKTTCPGLMTSFHSQAKDVKKDKDDTSEHFRCKICPFMTDHLEHSIKSSSTVPPVTPYSLNEILFPLLFAEYKRNYDKVFKGFRQCQMYCISAVDFFAALGVEDFPVFGLVTAGYQGSIMMAWRSSTMRAEADGSSKEGSSGYNILMDQNLISFDLSEPLDAYRFAIAAHRIFLRQSEELKKRLKGKDIRAVLDSPSFNNWAMKPKPKDQNEESKKEET